MKKVILLLLLLESVASMGQTGKSKTIITNPVPVKALPYEVGDVICSTKCYRWDIHGWGNSDTRFCEITVKASVEKVTKEKIQISIISTDRKFVSYDGSCWNSEYPSEVYNMKYNDLDLITDKLYWIDPYKYLTWTKCD